MPKQIEVIVGYRGWDTKEEYIEPAVYDVDDPKLHGLADFLVESKRAQWYGWLGPSDPSGFVPSDQPTEPAEPIVINEPVESNEDSNPDVGMEAVAHDDFQQIAGVGKATESQLVEAGYLTFNDVYWEDPETLAQKLNLKVEKVEAIQQWIEDNKEV